MEKLRAFLTRDIAGIPVWAIVIAIVIGLFFARRVLQEKEAEETDNVEEDEILSDSDLLDEGLLNGTDFGGGSPPETPPFVVRIDPSMRPDRKPCFYKWGMLFYVGDWSKLWIINRGKPRNQKISKQVKRKGKMVSVPISGAEFARRNPKIAACLKTKVEA
jgi:hypothetical protein